VTGRELFELHRFPPKPVRARRMVITRKTVNSTMADRKKQTAAPKGRGRELLVIPGRAP
jgi:hypothetical protein